MVETLTVNGRGTPRARVTARPSITGWRLPLAVAVEVHCRDHGLAVNVAGNENQARGDRRATKTVADPFARPEQLRAFRGPCLQQARLRRDIVPLGAMELRPVWH